MKELPLFPLNTVLFPGMPLSLHIFEERYKLMINRCIEQREPFGVVLIANAKGDTNPLARPHTIGCSAQITQVQPMGEGRMKITAIGRERFQIVSLEQSHPYLVGIVEEYPIEEANPREMYRRSRGIRGLVDRYLELLKETGQIQFDAPNLPDNPMALAYLSAVLLQTEAAEKQELLASETAINLFGNLRSTYQREIILMRAMLSPPENNDFRGIYSLS